MSNIKPTYVSPADGTPKPVNTSTDSISANAVYVQNSATPDTSVGISRDGSNNLVLTDAAYSKTLAAIVTGGGATQWTEATNTDAPNISIPAASWIPSNAGINVDAVIAPKGTGALLARVPNDLATGGAKRGDNAVDLQTTRTLASQVASGAHSVIVGGQSNTVGAANSVIVGGELNSISSAGDGWSTIAGGYRNQANFGYGFVGGGQYNKAALNSVVAGGNGNETRGEHTAVVGGQGNLAGAYGGLANGAFVGGGFGNFATGYASAAMGGSGQQATGSSSVIGGGNGNTASGTYASIFGGDSHTASGDYSSILGGLSNYAASYAESVGGGRYNYNFSGTTGSWVTTDALWSIGNGTGTGASGSNAITVLKNAKTGIGLGKTKPSEMLDVGGNVKFSGVLMPNNLPGSDGQVLTSKGASTPPIWTTPVSGATYWTETVNTAAPNNTIPATSWTPNDAASSVDAVIAPKNSGALLASVPDNTATGGIKRGNNAVDFQTSRYTAAHVASGPYSVLVGGTRNTSSDYYSTLVGGNSNEATGDSSFVGGGEGNVASGTKSSVPGGTHNRASGTQSTVSGGGYSTASGTASVVAGGYNNTASSAYSSIGGGKTNTASGSTSVVGGGESNTASGVYASVTGGLSNTTASYTEAVGGGQYNYSFGGTADSWVSTDALWTLGNGTSGAARSNAVAVLKDGSLGVNLGQGKPSEKLHVAGNVRFSGALMPNNTAGTSGQVLTSAGANSPPTWTTVSAGTPASPTNSIQFNNAGAFGGSSNLTYNGSTLALSGGLDVRGSVDLGIDTGTGAINIGTAGVRNIQIGPNASNDTNLALYAGQNNGVVDVRGYVLFFGFYGGYSIRIGSGSTAYTALTANSNSIELGVAAAADSIKLAAADAAGGITIQSGTAGTTLTTTGPLTVNGSTGTSGQVLTSNGSGAPTWTTVSGGDGTLQDAYDASASPATITLANGKGLEIVPDTGATAGMSLTAADAPLGIYNSGASGFIEISAADAGTSIWGYTAVAIDAANGPVNIGTSVPSATNVNIGTTNKTVKLTGQLQLATTGSTSIEIGTPGGSSTLSLDTTSLALNGSEGNPNDVLTSQGPSLPPIWAPASGGGGLVHAKLPLAYNQTTTSSVATVAGGAYFSVANYGGYTLKLEIVGFVSGAGDTLSVSLFDVTNATTKATVTTTSTGTAGVRSAALTLGAGDIVYEVQVRNSTGSGAVTLVAANITID